MIILVYIYNFLKIVYEKILNFLNILYQYLNVIIPVLLLIIILSLIYGFKPKKSGSTYIVAKKKRGKTARLVLSAINIMRDRKRLKKSNGIIDKLKVGGFEKLENVNQLVYSDYRVTKKNYYNKKIIDYSKNYNALSLKQKEYLQKNVNNYISIFNIGAKHTDISLFNELTLPPYALVQLDEINKGYNSRLSIDFPDAVATWHQTSGHNDIMFEMTSHRLPEADAKIREIVDFYEDIKFYWEIKMPFVKFTKRFPFVRFYSRVVLSIHRVWHYTDIEDIEKRKKPDHLLKRLARWLAMLPYESGRKLYIYLGGLRYHYDYRYLRPYHYDINSNFNYSVPPYHNYNIGEYYDFIKKSSYVRPLEFGRESKRERRRKELEK